MPSTQDVVERAGGDFYAYWISGSTALIAVEIILAPLIEVVFLLYT
jgi:hypothetical protein